MTNKLTYNDTTSDPAAKIGFVNYLNKSLGVIDLIWAEPTAGYGTVDVYVGEGASGSKVGTIPYTIDSTQVLYVVVDGITIKNETDTQLEYNFNTFGIGNVSAAGTINDSATAGFLQLEFHSGSEYGIDIVSSFLPLMVSLAVLGMIVKMFDKLGKQR